MWPKMPPCNNALGTAHQLYHFPSLFPKMLLLSETVLFYWDFFNTQPSSAKNNIMGVRKVKDWKEKYGSTKVAHTTRVASRASSLSNPTSHRLKGSAKSTHSSATQPPPTPVSVSSIVIPTSYLDENDDSAKLENFTQDNIGKRRNTGTGVT